MSIFAPYTPSLDEARKKYATGATWQHQGFTSAADEFDRLIAQVRAKAWDEGATAAFENEYSPEQAASELRSIQHHNPYREGQ